MPFPWEEGWETGDLGGAVDRQARKNVESKEEKAKTAEENSASIEKQIADIDRKIATIRSNYFDKQRGDKAILEGQLEEVKANEIRIEILRELLSNIRENLEQALEVLPEISQRVVELRQNLADREEEIQALLESVLVRPSIETKLATINNILATEDDILEIQKPTG